MIECESYYEVNLVWIPYGVSIQASKTLITVISHWPTPFEVNQYQASCKRHSNRLPNRGVQCRRRFNSRANRFGHSLRTPLPLTLRITPYVNYPVLRSTVCTYSVCSTQIKSDPVNGAQTTVFLRWDNRALFSVLPSCRNSSFRT